MSISAIDSTTLENRFKLINQSLGWEKNVPTSDRLNFRQTLINLHREYNKIKYAIEERPSVAVFGESQMGKSYLVSAIMSTPNCPFKVTDGKKSYNFINDINPSSPNSTIEATGVITRFTTNHQADTAAEGYLRAQLLSLADIVLILSEAYYNQVDYSHENIPDAAKINEYLQEVEMNDDGPSTHLIKADDILDIREYMQQSSIQKKCPHILNSRLFELLLTKYDTLSDKSLISILSLLWNRNKELSRVFDDLLSLYKKLEFSTVVYAQFESVLKKQGTLLDVARLDEMYGEPEVKNSEYTADVTVRLPSGKMLTIKKSFFSALIAELCFTLPEAVCKERNFLRQLDILDFPGARRPEQIKEEKLNEGKNLPTVIRRGKVSYLFNKYSAAKRITTLLFCHNNNQSAESTMGSLLNEWVNNNIGKTPEARSKYISRSELSPLFIIGTWFNKDLEYQGEGPNDRNSLNERWQRRFNVVLEKEVLKSLGDTNHWFNNWTKENKSFSNIYMLRDFKYSKSIFKGYDPDKNKPEEELIEHEKYPTFMDDLRSSFVNNDFVKQHFSNAKDSWNGSATVGKDGTGLIVKGLDTIAPQASLARNEKFVQDANACDEEFKTLLEQFYHPDNSEEQLKLAKRQTGDVNLQIDKQNGKDADFFGTMMDALMISEADMYEMLHNQLLGTRQQLPISSVESNIIMGAHLDPSEPRKENIKRLCVYLGLDDETECEEKLSKEDIDLEELLSKSQMVVGQGEQLVNAAEKLWHDGFLSIKTTMALKDRLQAISNIVNNLWSVYKLLGLHARIVTEVNDYLNTLKAEACIGILADFLAMKFNSFVNTFGYIYMPDSEKEKIKEQSKKLNLGLNVAELECKNPIEHIKILEDLYDTEKQMANSPYSPSISAMLLKLPQYNQIACWKQRLRFGFLYACQLPDYDTKANEELRKMLEKLKA